MATKKWLSQTNRKKEHASTKIDRKDKSSNSEKGLEDLPFCRKCGDNSKLMKMKKRVTCAAVEDYKPVQKCHWSCQTWIKNLWEWAEEGNLKGF